MIATRDWRELNTSRQDARRMICAGLDLTVSRLPGNYRHMGHMGQVLYAQNLVDSAGPIVGYFKINVAFYGGVVDSPLIQHIHDIVEYIHAVYPEVVVILDAKLGDIDATNIGYVEMVFDRIGADAVTINPYVGRIKGLQPFLDRADKGIIVLCRTSNDGGAEFQDLSCRPSRDSITNKWYSGERHYKLEHPDPVFESLDPYAGWMPLYEFVARRVVDDWNSNGNCALVFGGTHTDELQRGREIVGDMPLLIPGVGTQGAKLKDVVPAGRTENGNGMIINNSSGASFAYEKSDDPQAVEHAALLAAAVLQQMHDEVMTLLGDPSAPPLCLECGIFMVRAGSTFACPSCGNFVEN